MRSGWSRGRREEPFAILVSIRMHPNMMAGRSPWSGRSGLNRHCHYTEPASAGFIRVSLGIYSQAGGLYQFVPSALTWPRPCPSEAGLCITMRAKPRLAGGRKDAAQGRISMTALQAPHTGAVRDLRGFQKKLETSEVFIFEATVRLVVGHLPRCQACVRLSPLGVKAGRGWRARLARTMIMSEFRRGGGTTASLCGDGRERISVQ